MRTPAEARPFVQGVRVASFREGPRDVVLYELEVPLAPARADGHPRGAPHCTHCLWIARRFSEFRALHRALVDAGHERIPPLPPTTLFKPSSPQSLRERSYALDEWLRALGAHSTAASSEAVMAFLAPDEASALVALPSPRRPAWARPAAPDARVVPAASLAAGPAALPTAGAAASASLPRLAAAAGPQPAPLAAGGSGSRRARSSTEPSPAKQPRRSPRQPSPAPSMAAAGKAGSGAASRAAVASGAASAVTAVASAADVARLSAALREAATAACALGAALADADEEAAEGRRAAALGAAAGAARGAAHPATPDAAAGNDGSDGDTPPAAPTEPSPRLLGSGGGWARLPPPLCAETPSPAAAELPQPQPLRSPPAGARAGTPRRVLFGSGGGSDGGECLAAATRAVCSPFGQSDAAQVQRAGAGGSDGGVRCCAPARLGPRLLLVCAAAAALCLAPALFKSGGWAQPVAVPAAAGHGGSAGRLWPWRDASAGSPEQEPLFASGPPPPPERTGAWRAVAKLSARALRASLPALRPWRRFAPHRPPGAPTSKTVRRHPKAGERSVGLGPSRLARPSTDLPLRLQLRARRAFRSCGSAIRFYIFERQRQRLV